MHNLQGSSEGGYTRTVFIGVFFLKRGSELLHVLVEVFLAARDILNSVRNPILLVFVNAANAVLKKHTRVHHIRNVFEHHPVKPLLMDVRINTACYVI